MDRLVNLSTLLRCIGLSLLLAVLPGWSRAAPLRIVTVASGLPEVKLPWVEATSPEVSRRINDVIFNRIMDAPSPASSADVARMLPKQDPVETGIQSASFDVLRNDGRLLVIVVRAEGCFKHCEEHFTDQYRFDARTGRQFEDDAVFTDDGKPALTRWFARVRVVKGRAALAHVMQAHSADEDEFEHYEHCVDEWNGSVFLPPLQVDAKGHWSLSAGGCSFTYRPHWDLLDGIEIPLPDALLAKYLNPYGKSLLLGRGNVLDPAPPAPRCVRTAPASAHSASLFRSLAFGDGHHLAVLADGRLVTWGQDDSGQLGRGERRGDMQRMPPQVVASGMAAVAAGQSWSAALGEDGTLWTWGDDHAGALGRGGAAPLETRPVALGHDYAQLRAGGFKGLALRRDGSLWTWGDRVARRDDANNLWYMNTPWTLGTGYAQIEMGPRGELQALARDGALRTWRGFASDGTPFAEDAPRELGDGFARLAGHGLQAAFKADGSLWAWGTSLAAMVDTAHERDRPPQRVGTGFAQVVSAADDVVAALKTDGSLWLTHTRGSVTQLEPVGCGYQRVALVGASWETTPQLQVQVVALRDDGSLVAWPARPATDDASLVERHARPSAAKPIHFGTVWRELEMVDGQWGNRGPELLAVDAQGQVWQRRDLRNLPPPASPGDWLERVELPK